MKKFQAMGGMLALAVATAFIGTPASAFTHHPSTPKERAQTADLNRQQLAVAQGQAPADQQAMNASSNQSSNVPTYAQTSTQSDQTGQMKNEPSSENAPQGK